MSNTIVWQFEDGKIIYVYGSDGMLKVINVVANDRSDAVSVADYLLSKMRV